MYQETFFENEINRPLAARLRPRTLEEYCGHKHLLGEGKVLRRLIESDNVSSMIFWGPPGVGKTTLARIIANRTKADFVDFSAVTSGIKEIKSVMEQANIYIWDEPLNYIDILSRIQIEDAILKYKPTLIFVEHDEAFVERVATKIVYIENDK